MLLEYSKLPLTGSLIPSISTDELKIKPKMKQAEATINRGAKTSPNIAV
jgi:hypothetical protein